MYSHRCFVKGENANTVEYMKRDSLTDPTTIRVTESQKVKIRKLASELGHRRAADAYRHVMDLGFRWLDGERPAGYVEPQPAPPTVPREVQEQAERLARDAAGVAEAARKMSDLMSGPVQAPAPLAEVVPFPVPAGDPRFFDIRAVEELDRLHRDEVVEVPRVAARVAAGPGTLPDPTESTPTYTFRVGFMRRVGWNPEKPNWGRFACVLMHQSDAIAGSMVPTIHPRSLVLVRRDPVTEAGQVRRRGIYLVDIPASAGDAERGLAIKRVTVETGFLRLESDAAGHAEITVPLDGVPLQTVIRGKVVWWSVEADQAE